MYAVCLRNFIDFFLFLFAIKMHDSIKYDYLRIVSKFLTHDDFFFFFWGGGGESQEDFWHRLVNIIVIIKTDDKIMPLLYTLMNASFLQLSLHMLFFQNLYLQMNT